MQAAGTSLEMDFTNNSYHDTLKRRFDLLQDTLAQVKAGLSELNHPHVLSPLRRNARKSVSVTEDKGIYHVYTKFFEDTGGLVKKEYFVIILG